MIDIKKAMDAIDLRRRILDVTVKALCARAGIAVNTYADWRKGMSPQLKKFNKLEEAIDALEREHKPAE